MDDGEAPCLVYQLMAGGTLEQRIFKATDAGTLQWPDRLNVAIGTARGLQYLHTFNGNGRPLIHGDIKPANILLDKSNLPKIGDFGLAREGSFKDADMEVSRVYGTRPYLPIEFLLDRQLSTKVDTFSFGVVLLELATGLRAHDNSYKFLSRHVLQFTGEMAEQQLMDRRPSAGGQNGLRIFKRLFAQGKHCSEANVMNRPSEMVLVLKDLIADLDSS